jgi:hypothetical protein
MCRLVSSGVTRAGLLLRKGTVFQRVILHSEAGSGMHSHSREAGFTQLLWIQGTISATLTAVGVDNQQQKGPSSGALAVEHSIPSPKQHPLVYKETRELSG